MIAMQGEEGKGARRRRTGKGADGKIKAFCYLIAEEESLFSCAAITIMCNLRTKSEPRSSSSRDARKFDYRPSNNHHGEK